jgi:murein DD-endopeptidase MepM/ murein hydrolase activator NlpD
MDFDKIGVQHVAKRRYPSPLRNAKHQASPENAGYNQKVRPRPDRSGAASGLEKSFERMFAKNKHLSNSGNGEKLKQEVYKRESPSRSSGFSISGSALKTTAIICGVLAVCLIGPNWDGITSWYSSQNVSGDSLRNQGTILDDPKIAGTGLPFPGDTPFDIWGQNAPHEPQTAHQGAAHQDAVQYPAVPEEDFPLNLTKLFETTNHEVRQNENLSVIANTFSVSMESIIALNNLKDATLLPIGKVLKIPNMNGVPYTVKRNDTLSKIAATEKIPVNAILDANDLRSDEIYQGQVLFLPGARMNSSEYLSAIRRRTPEKSMISPLAGRLQITSAYGWRLDPVYPKSGVRRFHEGIDLRGAMGTPVKAVLDGFVEESGHNRVMGNFVILKHQEHRTMYAHLSAILVRKGEQVRQGRDIGKVGNSGYTDGGSHLHFAVFDRNNNSINPAGLLK